MNRRTVARQRAEAARQNLTNMQGFQWSDFLFGPSGAEMDDRSLAYDEALSEQRFAQSQEQQALLTQQANSKAARGIAANFALQNYGQRIDPNIAMGLGQIQEGLGTEAAYAASQMPQFNPAVAAQLQEQQLQAAEQQMGRWGSGLDYNQFQKLNNSVNTYAKGIGNARFVSDVISQTTPLQLQTRAMAGVVGQLETTMFELYRPIQALSESKESVLREGEREAINDYLNNPTGFISQLMSFDAATVGKMDKLEQALQRNMDSALIGLDDRTLMLLGDSMQIPQNAFTPPSANGTIRDPKMRPMTQEEEQQLQSGFESMQGMPIF